jgi:hypothetical protein
MAVGDTKYKRLEVVELPNADLYQLLAYCVSLGRRPDTSASTAHWSGCSVSGRSMVWGALGRTELPRNCPKTQIWARKTWSVRSILAGGDRFSVVGCEDPPEA